MNELNDMNTRDARRRILADPHNLDPALEVRVQADPALAAFRASLLSCDNAIAETLGGVVPPKGLAERIILRARYRQGTRWGIGLAASAALVAALLSLSVLLPGNTDAIAVAMIDHVIESPGELADDGGVSTEQARESFQRIGVTFRDAGYRIRHMGECVVAGRVGRHLVVSTPDGLATLVVLPVLRGEVSRRRTLEKGNFRGVVLPQASVAIAALTSGSISTPRLESLARQMFTLTS